MRVWITRGVYFTILTKGCFSYSRVRVWGKSQPKTVVEKYIGCL